jgi:hypothetical protein
MTFPAYRELRATMAARGDIKPIWFTEFGWATETGDAWGVTAAQQADYLTRAYWYIEQDPYVQVACWYNFRNNYWAGNANTWEDNLGLMRTDFSRKPSYDAFKNYVPGTAPPPSTSSTSPAPAPTTGSGSGSGRRKTRTTTRVRISSRPLAGTASARRRARSRRFAITGNVAGARRGLVVLRLQRRIGRSRTYRTVMTVRTTVRSAGAFTRTLTNPRFGRWRVQARYLGSADSAPSVSRYAYFTV